MSLKVDFVHRVSKPETPVKGCFYWVQNSTYSQIWFAPSDDPSELILLNGYEGFDDLIERLGTLEGKVNNLPDDISERLSKLKNEILSQVDKTYEKKLTWQVIK